MLHDLEIGDALKMTEIGGEDTISKFKSGDSDEQIRECNLDAGAGQLTVKQSSLERDRSRNRCRIDGVDQIFNEMLSSSVASRGIRSCGTMRELHQGDHGQGKVLTWVIQQEGREC